MRGKYINTTIMLALLAGNKRKNSGSIKETIATTANHTVIWCKGKKSTTATQETAVPEELTC